MVWSTEMLGDLRAQESYRFAQLLHSVLTVFNRNPTVEAFIPQGREDPVVIVQAFADDPVLQVFRVAHRTILPLQILDRPADQVTIRSVHRDDAVFDRLQ